MSLADYVTDFWHLFPWSWTGIRSLAIFSSIFPMYIVRKANLHLYRIQSDTIARTVYRRVFRMSTVLVVAAMTISTLVVTGLYLRNCRPSKDLGLLGTHR